MRTFLKATQDATIYQRYSGSNSGLDEILEIGKVARSTDVRNMMASSSARTLITFDIPSNGQYPSSSVYYLNLRIANAEKINRYQRIEVYPISRSWIEGSGYFYQDVRNAEDGASWTFSKKDVSWNTVGGDIISTISASYEVSKYPIEDIKINVTNIIAPVVSGSNDFQWNGLLLKFPTVDELDTENVGNLKLFSSNTHTIFEPTLEVVYNNQTFITGSLKPIPQNKFSVVAKNLKEGYTLGEVDKVYLVVRDAYPDRRFDAVQRFRTTYYLPSSSYYRIRDQQSGVVIYDFDQYSAIDCDRTGSYIMLDTSGLQVDRYYEMDIKIQNNNLVLYPEFNYTFRVDRNGI